MVCVNLQDHTFMIPFYFVYKLDIKIFLEDPNLLRNRYEIFKIPDNDRGNAIF